MKAVIDADNDSILGFAMLGAQAGEVIAVVQTAMWAALPSTMFRDGIIAYPTIAERLNLLFAKVPAV
jgi:probable pyridine nucleotide-disulfide oxidoreductase